MDSLRMPETEGEPCFYRNYTWWELREVSALNLLGDAVRDAMHPRLRT